MPYPYPITKPFASGRLKVDQHNEIFWEISGDPDGKPVVLLHGGPGAGSASSHRKMFDPERFMIVQFDQRNCGRSTPYAGEALVDLSANTTTHLVSDIEALRAELGLQRWVVWGGSWGTTLGLAYAQTHPERTSALLLGSVVTTSRAEVEWVTRTMGRLFPESWRRFVETVPPDKRDGNLALSYNELLMDPDPDVHTPAALEWCDWEDTHVSLAYGYDPFLRDQEPPFRLCFARLVTHYWANAAFLEDGQLLANASQLHSVPVFIAHGRRDVSSPVDIASQVHEALPHSELFIAEDEGHGGPKQSEWMASIADSLVG